MKFEDESNLQNNVTEESVKTWLKEIFEEKGDAFARKTLKFWTGIGALLEKRLKLTIIDVDQNLLPRSSTCYNNLLIPFYPNKTMLMQRLEIAVNAAVGFGNA